MNFWGWTWKCHTYTSPGTFTVSLSEAYLLSHFESTRQNILSWTGDVTHLQYLNLNGNYLRDLPTTKLLYNDLTLFNTIEVTWNCIDPDVQDSNNADWIDGHHGNYRRDAQYLCAGVSYDPKKPVTGTVPGPVEATLDLYGPANQKSAFLANNPGFSFDHTFIRNGTYIFNFNNTDTSSTNLRE